MTRLIEQNVTEPPPGAAHLPALSARSLPERLRTEINGEIRFDDGSRALYATDGSNYRQTPIGVVMPRTR